MIRLIVDIVHTGYSALQISNDTGAFNAKDQRFMHCPYVGSGSFVRYTFSEALGKEKIGYGNMDEHILFIKIVL